MDVIAKLSRSKKGSGNKGYWRLQLSRSFSSAFVNFFSDIRQTFSPRRDATRRLEQSAIERASIKQRLDIRGRPRVGRSKLHRAISIYARSYRYAKRNTYTCRSRSRETNAKRLRRAEASGNSRAVLPEIYYWSYYGGLIYALIARCLDIHAIRLKEG